MGFCILLREFYRTFLYDMCHWINVVTIRTTSQSGCFQWDGTTAQLKGSNTLGIRFWKLYSGLQGRFFNFYICRSKMTVRVLYKIIFSFFDSIESQIKLSGQFFVRCRMTLGIISHPYISKRAKRSTTGSFLLSI